MYSNVLLTGGSGLLNKWLDLEADKPTSQELDITQPVMPGDYDLVVHAAAYTDVAGAEIEKSRCFEINVRGTLNMLLAYPETPFVFISTEYAHNPCNFYSITKSLAEQLVTTHPNYLIIRTLFKPFPWPFEKAFEDQWTQGGYVTDVAPRIKKEIEEWDGKSKLVYVGDGKGRKTMYELALESRVDVKRNSIRDIKNVKIPSDYR